MYDGFGEFDFHASSDYGEGDQHVEDIANDRNDADDGGPSKTESATTACQCPIYGKLGKDGKGTHSVCSSSNLFQYFGISFRETWRETLFLWSRFVALLLELIVW
jgi:hypothetical protein